MYLGEERKRKRELFSLREGGREFKRKIIIDEGEKEFLKEIF